MAEAERPLTGIRILDLTRFMAGPLGTQILGDLGAEIIKVERSNCFSDFSRNTEPTFGSTSAYFLAINNGKKDIGLNLENEKHKELLFRLAEKCDVIADNFRPGVTEKLGIDYSHMKKRNPNVIYSTVSGFGYDGPYRTRGCVDTVSQAMSGFISLTSDEQGDPIRAGSSVADVCAALYETVAILASIIYRDKTGEGGMVDTPMLSSMLTVSCELAADYLKNGTIYRGTENRDRNRPFFRTFPAKDGGVMADISEETCFLAFVHLLESEEILQDSRFASPRKRMENMAELNAILDAATGRMTMTELAFACRNAGIPAGEVNTIERISRSGYMEEQQMIRQVYDSLEGEFQVLGSPLKFDQFDLPKRNQAPQPGEDTVEILKDFLGMTEEEIKNYL